MYFFFIKIIKNLKHTPFKELPSLISLPISHIAIKVFSKKPALLTEWDLHLKILKYRINLKERE